MKQIYKLTFGEPESYTPAKLLKKQGVFASDPKQCPLELQNIAGKPSPRGYLLTLPLEKDEYIYGFGLQMKSFVQNGKKKTLRVNSDPAADTGDSHAPVPFYVSTAGYAVYIDTARYASFYCGSAQPISGSGVENHIPSDDVESLYQVRAGTQQNMIVDIPGAKGADLYIFTGNDMKEAVANYNLFSGGGYVPPMWGLGIWYRTYTFGTQSGVLKQIQEIRDSHIPCDVYGLEPGWQGQSYSCNYKWNSTNFPDHEEVVKTLVENHYHINLWNQIFIHPTAEIYHDIKPYAGDYTVWNGLVPDFSLEETCRIFAEFHSEHFISRQISGYKTDECDNSDFCASAWSFPEFSQFPSGMDGEQMHSMIGILYQKMMQQAFAESNRRTLSQIRSSGAFAAPYPFVLYSDLYGHHDFVRALVNSGFSGLSWSPEVRQCNSITDLYRRIATVLFSPLALINAWMIPHMPWKQFDLELNKRGIFLEKEEVVTQHVRGLFQLRMQFLPYLYAAYYQYWLQGIPPIRALVMDYPSDRETYGIDDQFLFGDSVMVAPVYEEQQSRKIYFPRGIWHDFYSGQCITGGQTLELEAKQDIFIFIQDGTLLPLAEPVEYIHRDSVLKLVPCIYGNVKEAVLLYEDDFESMDYRNGCYNTLKIRYENSQFTLEREGSFSGIKYML